MLLTKQREKAGRKREIYIFSALVLVPLGAARHVTALIAHVHLQQTAHIVERFVDRGYVSV